MLFSVLICTYKEDNPRWLDLALTSIWDDQVLKPSEIVLVQDGRIPACLEQVVLKWKEKLANKLCMVVLTENKGLASALNAGLLQCKFELVARMDPDDISLPSRFAHQINFMKKHKDISVVGTWVEEMCADMKASFFVKKLPTCPQDLIKFAKFRSPLAHPSVMMRKADVLACGGYPATYPEDYHLWSIMLSRQIKLANIPSVHLQMRTGSDFLKRRGKRFLLGELKVLKIQKDMFMISWKFFFIKLICLIVLRNCPIFLRKIFYKKMRRIDNALHRAIINTCIF